MIWWKSKTLSIGGICSLVVLVVAFQNCGRVQFQAKEEKLSVGSETIFSCSEPSSPCEVNGVAGVMECMNTDGGPQWGSCTLPPNGSTTTTTLATNQSCIFKGVTYAHGQSFTSYQMEAVAADGNCQSQTRTCINGSLSGSYQFLTCVKENGDCSLGGTTVANGNSVTTFQTASVPYGQICQSQSRTCQNKNLSGSYTFLTCIPEGPKSCLFNGQTIAHGASVTGFQAMTVPYGANCSSQRRLCSNGVLSGNYSFASCSVAPANNCSFNGQTVVHGTSVNAFQSASVAFGNSCLSQLRSCQNGILSGAYTSASCSVAPANNCSFNGQTVAHASSVTAYQDSSVPAGSSCLSQARVCNNGNLSGSYLKSSCAVEAAKTCVFNGQTIASGQSIPAFQASNVAYGQSCVSQNRVCTNGNLSGSYLFAGCTVNAPASCSLNGQTVLHGSSVLTYSTASVSYGSQCAPQTRTCNNGTLSGTYLNSTCTVSPPNDCNFNGVAVNHGASIEAYTQATVSFGANCNSLIQTRTCNNGTLSGSAQYSNCSILPANNCVFNGQTVMHGASIQAYQSSSVTEPATCISETRVCNNGQLGGSGAYPSCSVTALPTAQCQVYYQYQLSGDFGTTAIASNGAWASNKNKDQDYNCVNGGCGLRVGVSCIGEAQVRLSYQYQEFSTLGIEQQTPWSGTDGSTKWGNWAMLTRPNHPKVECGNGLNCGLKVNAETLNGKPCSVSYQYQAENNRFSPFVTDGAWSTLTGIDGGDNCDDGNCGIRIQLSCQQGMSVDESFYDYLRLLPSR